MTPKPTPKPIPETPGMFFANTPAEDAYEPAYTAWKAAPGPAGNAAVLTALRPVIDGAVRTHVGEPNPLITSRARAMTLEGLASYDPAKGKLKTHVYNHLLGLKRVNRKQTNIVRAPERVQYDRANLDDATRQLGDELGREPTDGELADRTGFSVRRMSRVRSYNPAASEGAVSDPETGAGFSGNVSSPGEDVGAAWRQIVYDDLDPYHQKVMELALGLNGRRQISNQAIAAKMGRSPGAISQAKGRIQKLIDEGDELDPFRS